MWILPFCFSFCFARLLRFYPVNQSKRSKTIFWYTLEQGSPTFAKLRATSWVPITARATSLIHTSEEKILLNLPLINDVNLCDDTHHLNGIFKTGRRTTNVALAGDLVPAGTMLVTPALESYAARVVGTRICVVGTGTRRSTRAWRVRGVRNSLCGN